MGVLYTVNVPKVTCQLQEGSRYIETVCIGFHSYTAKKKLTNFWNVDMKIRTTASIKYSSAFEEIKPCFSSWKMLSLFEKKLEDFSITSKYSSAELCK